ncbi:YjiH family protein [Alkalibacillus aidingensis]|uniref:YjiH family protein n=1 Tax=Alkalibacillus aidingensis TaxID=2747607 RepID=UPI0016614047|nr:YjiH family protein [Alkalibacillus aidingensis]
MEELEQKVDVGIAASKDKWRFLIPALIGVLLFLVPVKFDGEFTIGIGILATGLLNVFESWIAHFVVLLLGVSFLTTVVAKTTNGKLFKKNEFLNELFMVTPFGLIIRGFGFLVGILTLIEFGPEMIISRDTGGVVLYDLAPVLLTWFLFAGLFLPLLMQYGLMEFIGALLRKIMRPLFTLPGRSSIDSMASWMGAGTVGVLVTTKQYDEGFYNKRESAVIATTFSVASIAFSLVIANMIGVGHLFIPFYITVVVACLVAAIIIPRIPPLSRKDETYFEEVGKQINESNPRGISPVKWGWIQALNKASHAKGLSDQFKNGIKTVMDIWLGLIPLVMSLGAIALIIVEFTPIFQVLSYPLIPLLELMNIPEASIAAPAMLVGFADMFLPAVIGSGIESELTRFVVGALSITQIIYMSEIGVLILRSNIPLKLHELFIIFVQRTVITLPIIVLIAQFIVFN